MYNIHKILKLYKLSKIALNDAHNENFSLKLY